ncbi:MAG: hypothetical protein COY42_18215 [Armatimonadetes bacterium CG_4_10_14_0_8_um_filter_66_14]|nr:MAG: hypothetical protein COY42_18215 [Armatimonadetes bacterium CG_4_10_14_0_8_um_filter_66_14]
MSQPRSRTYATAVVAVLLGAMRDMSAQTTAPTDWAAWKQHRGQVQHPAAAIKPADLDRAKMNLERFDWAKQYLTNLRRSADAYATQLTPEYLSQVIERTTPGCVGPCPACRAKGLPWHPNGQWSWSASKPDQLTCSVCKTVFPNEEFPEEIVLQSTWDPEQKFGFVGGETFKCFGYTNARPSLSGIIRARKLGHATGQLHTLALAYALTDEPKYAQAAKAVLLRLAEVFPKYLVRAGYGYGEYTDCDPHVASERIDDLPNDELVYPPNRPDRKLYAGYWAASRVGSSGMDGGWVSNVAESYDLTCTAQAGDKPVYSDDERLRIERDVLLESTYLAACDDSINNKSVGNRAGCAMVGLVVGHPGLVRFGLDGFKRTVEEWFLPDGGTSESPAYAMMTMGGVDGFALMFRDYSDPEGYVGADGKRLEHFNACRDTRYGDCWQGLIWNLQGDLRHPPSADSYRTTSLGATYAELIAVAYPTDEHVALLKEYAGKDLAAGSASQALFCREPALADREVPPFALPDVAFPFLSQGYLRTGAAGRDSLLMLNASDYGGHHHLDSLNLYYWQAGHELLSDLGYLWDHPDSYQTRRAFAHNLVLLDGSDQATGGRGGSFHLFSVTPRVKVMEASSKAYPAAEVYRRTCVQVDHGEAGSYVVDLFRVKGGTRRQYLFHGPGTAYQVQGLDLQPAVQSARPAPFALRFHLPQVSELYVDDVEIRQVQPGATDGPNLAPNGSVATGALNKPAPGWGVYTGDGSADMAVVTPGRTDAQCVRFRALKPHENGRMNAALLVGESDGYRGAKAIAGVLGATYKVRCWIKGNADHVNLDAVTWPNDPASAADRVHVTMRQLSAAAEWKQYEAAFTLPSTKLPLENLRKASGEAPWRAVWSLPEDYTFVALSPGRKQETVLVGDGWGQRDHRNTDRGATLPYLIRQTEGGDLDTFVSVFCGAPKDAVPAKSVKLLPLPAEAPEGAVAVAVETTRGTDVIVSSLTSQATVLATPLGELKTDGLVAAVLSSDGTPSSACLVGGTRLSIGDLEVTANPALGGTLLEVGSAGGDSWFVLDGQLPEDCVGQTLFVQDGDLRRADPIRGVAPAGDHTKVFAKKGNVGFEARPGQTWELPSTAFWAKL